MDITLTRSNGCIQYNTQALEMDTITVFVLLQASDKPKYYRYYYCYY